MRTLPAVVERDRFAAAAYQVDRLQQWMEKRSKQLRAAGLHRFVHQATKGAAIVSRRVR